MYLISLQYVSYLNLGEREREGGGGGGGGNVTHTVSMCCVIFYLAWRGR